MITEFYAGRPSARNPAQFIHILEAPDFILDDIDARQIIAVLQITGAWPPGVIDIKEGGLKPQELAPMRDGVAQLLYGKPGLSNLFWLGHRKNNRRQDDISKFLILAIFCLHESAHMRWQSTELFAS